MIKKYFLTTILMLITSLVTTQNLMAGETVDQLLEKARAKGHEIEKLKKILVEEPDQNVRLAAFGLMIKNGDTTMREVALDAGLSSADSLLQAAAFKEAILGLDRIHLNISVHPDDSEKNQEECKAWLDKNGEAKVVKLSKKDPKNGSFTNGSEKGQVSGTLLTLFIYRASGNLRLENDDTLNGRISLDRDKISCLASAKFR